MYHYTHAQHVTRIIETGHLIPAIALIEPWEVPILWFSANPKWEPTANKMMKLPNGQYRRLTREETRQLSGALFRFLLPESRLLTPWPEIATVANIAPKMIRQLEKAGRAQGANPSDWYGTTESIPIGELALQVMTADGHDDWLDVPMSLAGASVAQYVVNTPDDEDECLDDSDEA